jgi:hypothetical protein
VSPSEVVDVSSPVEAKPVEGSKVGWYNHPPRTIAYEQQQE